MHPDRLLRGHLRAAVRASAILGRNARAFAVRGGLHLNAARQAFACKASLCVQGKPLRSNLARQAFALGRGRRKASLCARTGQDAATATASQDVHKEAWRSLTRKGKEREGGQGGHRAETVVPCVPSLPVLPGQLGKQALQDWDRQRLSTG